MTSFENSSNTFSYFLTDFVRLDMCVCACANIHMYVRGKFYVFLADSICQSTFKCENAEL